jgi:hypothetical protein
VDDSRFDDFTRAFVTSRRGALKILLGGAAAGIASVLLPEEARMARRCRSLVRRCNAGADCCSGVCDPASGRCVCGADTEECLGHCVSVEQFQTDVNNCGSCRNRCPRTRHGAAICTGGVCGTVCDAGFPQCGERCCAEGRDCCNGDCCEPNQCCTADGCVRCKCVNGIDSFDDGEINPDNACEFCDPRQNRRDWTIRTDGDFCGGVSGRVCCNGECCSPTECCDGVQCTCL